jgi:hypothetical protein
MPEFGIKVQRKRLVKERMVEKLLIPSIEARERETLQDLAHRWSELAGMPVMAERKRLWKALKDLRAERPMVLFETWTLENYVREDELVIRQPYLREIERLMRRTIRQAEEIGDDFVIDSFFPVYWDFTWPDYGVGLDFIRAEDNLGSSLGFHYNHPIQTVDDAFKLQHKSWILNREQTFRNAALLDDLFGKILPVKVVGTGGFIAALTSDLYKLIGNDRLLSWMYDQPETIHQIMAFLRDDRMMYYGWLEAEGMLGRNDNAELVGSGSPGYVSGLPQADFTGRVRMQDLWIWIESQETTMISPKMFAEFFLPYMADISRNFGLVYYGCCEPVHDRWERIIQQISNIRAVSISPWCNQERMGELLGKQVVFSRKPIPWLISGEQPDWEKLEKDLDETIHAARNCNLEIIYRDVYRIHEDRSRLSRWVELVRSRIGS